MCQCCGQVGDLVDGGLSLAASPPRNLDGAHLNTGRQHHGPPVAPAQHSTINTHIARMRLPNLGVKGHTRESWHSLGTWQRRSRRCRRRMAGRIAAASQRQAMGISRGSLGTRPSALRRLRRQPCRWPWHRPPVRGWWRPRDPRSAPSVSLPDDPGRTAICFLT